MASPTTAAAPDAPTGSSPLSINGQPRLVGWFQEICLAFLKLLSPSGATAYDSGWVNLTLESGWTAAGSTPPAVRRIGKLVIFRGNLVGTATTTFTKAATIPAGFRPPFTLNFAQTANTTTSLAASAEAGGDLKLYASASTSAWRPLNNIIYAVD